MTTVSRFAATRLSRVGVLLVAFALACSSTLGNPSDDAGSSGGSAGGKGGGMSGGGGISGGGVSGGGMSGGDVSGGGVSGRGGIGGNCNWGGGGGDPTPVPLQCNPPNWATQPSAVVDGQEIIFTANWCGTCRGGALCFQAGLPRTMSVSVQGTWATVVEQGLSACGEFTARLLPSAAASDGDIVLTGQFDGQTQCHEPLSCPLSETYNLSRGDGGVISIIRRNYADGGSGPAGTGGGGRAGAGGSSALVPCDGLGYFVQEQLCASTFEAQVAKDAKNLCDRATVSIVSCSNGHQWSTDRGSLPTDPISCTYDAAGSLVAAQICTDHTLNAAWNCDGGGGGPPYPFCLIAGHAADFQGSCTSTNPCSATGGAGGSGGGGG